jgi:hypothetical protein
MNRINIIGIISLKPNIEPIEIKQQIPKLNHEISFKLHFNRDYYDQHLKEYKGEVHLESSCYIELEDYIDHDIDYEAEYGNFDRGLLLLELVKINKFIDVIRYSYELRYPNRKLHFHNIGIDDFLFHRIDINGENKIKSFKDNFSSEEHGLEIEKIVYDVPFEWSTFMKAIDLLDNGYYNESLIIGFNLMDYCIQKTLKSLMVNLQNDKEKESLLRQIKEQRVKTYLGLLFKLLSGNSLLDSVLKEKNVEKINSLRNKVVHSGEDCTYDEVRETLKMVYFIIKRLNVAGNQNFKITDRIVFY